CCLCYFCFFVFVFFFFFFQAEDGIRDRNVTGVQTCALPILKLSGLPARVTVPALLLTVRALRSNGVPDAPMSLVAVYDDDCVARSEERRVGKECRCRWWPEY